MLRVLQEEKRWAGVALGRGSEVNTWVPFQLHATFPVIDTYIIQINSNYSARHTKMSVCVFVHNSVIIAHAIMKLCQNLECALGNMW